MCSRGELGLVGGALRAHADYEGLEGAELGKAVAVGAALRRAAAGAGMSSQPAGRGRPGIPVRG